MELEPKGNNGLGKFEPNEHWPLIERIWQLARTMGGARIAEVLMEEGFTSPYPRQGKPKLLSDEVVRNILRRRSAMGEFQPTTKGNKPNGDPIPGVFPPVVTPAEFNEIRGIIEDRDTGLGHTKTKKKSNLFEKRSFCANCGGLMGVAPTSPKPLADGSIKAYPGKFRCRVGHKTKGKTATLMANKLESPTTKSRCCRCSANTAGRTDTAALLTTRRSISNASTSWPWTASERKSSVTTKR